MALSSHALPAVGTNRLIAAIVGIVALLAWAFLIHLDGIPESTQHLVTVGIISLGLLHAIQIERQGVSNT